MVDVAAKGRTGTEFGMEIERGKIREFAAAIGSVNPAYLADPAPVSPATFLTTMVFWQSEDADPWREVRMDPTRGLHAEQEFIFHGPPPRAGDKLTCRSRIEDIYDKEGRRGRLTFAVMVTEFRDETGRLVAEARLTGVETAGLGEPS
ncbi:MaoC family dehydratase N-terminal domain-containing protein [Micromonospora sp. NPDC020750]|uniref:FAS1-like dehydratase domain-containing protein n=1 Tax=unclassified Micromonospora TaxID=2617518 RepID=UPI0037B9A16D